MTVEQCGMFIEAQSIMQNERFKETAILLDGLSKQITSGVASMLSNKNKAVTLSKLYPDLFRKQNTAKRKAAAKSKTQIEQESWLNFLL
jgi:hypothetical protein